MSSNFTLARAEGRKLAREFPWEGGVCTDFAVLAALAEEGAVDRSTVADAIRRYGIDPELADPRIR